MLLPARNCASDLPDYLASVGRFADAVVALDDGSTDSTGDVLAAHSLVQVLLANPRRPDYRGWDDAANRNRLLSSAAGLEPDWILSLDADERIDAEDAAALRRFVETEADPSCAYLLRCYRMLEDLISYDRSHLWVGRLFAFSPGQRFPARRLHLVPIPTSIDRKRWRKTTLRVQHLAGITAEHRRARFDKYAQADPLRAYQPSYDHLLTATGASRPWQARPPSLPVVQNSACPLSVTETPTLSAVIVVRRGGEDLERAVRSVFSQEPGPACEVIVVTTGSHRAAIATVQGRFPRVQVVDEPQDASTGQCIGAGLLAAAGTYVWLTEPDVEVAPGSLAARLEAHQLGYAMVTGTALNGTLTRSGWATYFLDHCSSLPDRPAGALDLAPAHCSYLGSALRWAAGHAQGRGGALRLNARLFGAGYGCYREPRAIVTVHGPRRIRELLRHHFRQGRATAGVLDERCETLPWRRHRLLRLALAGPLRVRDTTRMVGLWGTGCSPHYRASFHLVVAGASAWWCGLGWQTAVEAIPSALRRQPAPATRGSPG